MENDFESELKGTADQAKAAKQQIAKYFKRYGDSGHQEARKHQLMFASKIMCTFLKCESRHLDIYCNVITEIFANHLCPGVSAKYWTVYVNCIRYFHYLLAEKKDYEKASLIYRHISAYDNKLQNNENSLTYIHMNSYQLFLQNSLKSQNPELAFSEATNVIENLTKLFNDVLESNKKQNFQYPDILKKTLSWLFLQNKMGAFYQFVKNLPQNKVKEMFSALFTLYGRQTFDKPFTESEIQEHAKFIIETIYNLLQLDVMDKMQLQLAIQLLGQCRTEPRLQANKSIAEFLNLLYDYLKLTCSQKSILNFQVIYSIRCERFKELLDKYSKNAMNQPWFGDFLVLLFYIHSQLQNITIFGGFWKQMSKPNCYTSMFKLFMELMKLAPCISAETKLFTINCCSSSRKHVILSFAQIALAAFVFYCQNVSEDDEKEEELANRDSNLTDYYKETIQNNLILIINHAFKIIDKMDCITEKSQEIEIILTRFKQATLSCKSYKQAGTCVSICELFLKIKTKIPGKEWPLLLRRVYKTVSQHISEAPHIGRDLQMCYIASMLHETINEIDIGQIRTQINIFYAADTNEQLTHENCLMHLYHNTTSLLRPHLEPSRKKLLHWMESQHVLKYHKSNTALLHSILKSSQTHYDFVIITKLGKLQTYAMAKISSIYKSLKTKAKESVNLSRLEQLTFGHVCVMLLNDMNSNQKFQVDSKDLNEDLLESLLMREEMSVITINNDLKRFKLAWEAFKAFEGFYEKYDSETISMNDALIDWESILDDLANLALCLQLSGYMEHCSQIWLLHYKCSRLIQDAFSALRGLTFFCEYSEHYGKNNKNLFELDEEIQYHFPTITQGLENLSNLQRTAYQNYILLAVLQIAHYYARTSRLSFAQMLLQYVEEKHSELSERQGRYDIILATMDVIKFRLLWKHFDVAKATAEEQAARTSAEKLLLHRCLLYEVQETLDRLYDFSYISSNDGLLYSILIIGLVQELAECTANRLCDNFINALFIATTKCALLMGLGLRVVQVMSMWMWVNLQMEYVEKAQTKLKIIEYVMGIKSLKELTQKNTKSISDIQSSTLLPINCSELLTQNQYNPGMEAIRRLAQVQLSPIKTDKLQLSPSHRNTDLKRYFKCNIDDKLMPQNDLIEWTLFMVGCLNARLYFLVEDYDQLDQFYERGSKWLQMRHDGFNKNYYKNIQLMAMQHYANFLRARRQYDKAVQCLEYGLELCENMKFYIDAVYYVNFQLQLMATRKEMAGSSNVQMSKLPTHSKIRRALQFNISPENIQIKEQAKKELKEKLLQNVMASGKKPTAIMRPLPSIVSGSGCSSSKKPKTQRGADCASSSSSSSTSSLDLKSMKLKPKLIFEICEDSIEIVEVTDKVPDAIVVSEETTKCIKRTKNLEENELHKTPKVIKNTTKTTKTTATKSAAKIKRPQVVPKYHIDIDLTDTLETSPTKSSTSSSLENLDAKENLNTNDLIAQMENLEIKSTKTRTKTPNENETKPKTIRGRGRKPNLVKETVAPVIIVLEDSPCTLKPAPSKETSKDKLKSTRNRATTRDKSATNEEDNDVDLITTTESRPRRQRKLILDINEKPNVPVECTTTTTTASVTRRRQRKIV